MNMFFDLGFDGGQHDEILLMYSIALHSRVYNKLTFYEYVLLFLIWEWSACWEYINLFLHFGLESGQHVETLPLFAIAMDMIVVNMLRFYE